MPRRGKRVTIARGIYQDASGIAIIVRVDGQKKEYRYPIGTPRAWLKEKRRAIEEEQAKRRGAGKHSLEAGVKAYFVAKTGEFSEASVQVATSELSAWTAALGPTTLRYKISEADVRKVRATWLAAGLKPKTVNNRLDRLRQLYRALDGKRAWTPVDEIDPLPVTRTPIERIDPAIINTTIAGLRAREERLQKDAKTRARFMVYASTGRRPSEIMRAIASDVDLVARVWQPRDGKGGFTPGIYLNDEMLIAWQLFISSEAWGVFNVNTFTRELHWAGWPKGVRPYHLRHTVGITLSEHGHDLDDIGPQLGHKRRETTRRHYVPVLGSRMQRMSESLDGRLGWSSGTTVGTSEGGQSPSKG